MKTPLISLNRLGTIQIPSGNSTDLNLDRRGGVYPLCIKLTFLP